MNVLAHWYVSEGDGVPWVVIQAEGEDGQGMHHVIAECDERVHAENIARALNSEGAVSALCEIATGGHAARFRMESGRTAESVARAALAAIGVDPTTYRGQ